MIELWFEAPERRMGNKQGIDGSQNLSISNLSISESQITESQLPSIFKAFMHLKRHKSIIIQPIQAKKPCNMPLAKNSHNILEMHANVHFLSIL